MHLQFTVNTDGIYRMMIEECVTVLFDKAFTC